MTEHRIADDLAAGVEEWAVEMTEGLEASLEKQAAFDEYLREHGAE